MAVSSQVAPFLFNFTLPTANSMTFPNNRLCFSSPIKALYQFKGKVQTPQPRVVVIYCCITYNAKT